MNASNFHRTTRSEPCPICDKNDWCLVAKDGSAAICSRIESQKLIQRPGRDQAGWLHVLRRDHCRREFRRMVKVATPVASIDFPTLASVCTATITTAQIDSLASSLGVSASSLVKLGIGWSAEHRAYSFPMKDASGTITGIRLRRPSGFKFAVTGSRQGLFYDSLSGLGELLVTEGPTDAAAGLDMGFQAIGRPSCTGGKPAIGWLVNGKYTAVIIAADADEPGQRGARDLARHLAVMHRDVRIITPPVKDVREWYQSGATASDVLSLAKPFTVKATVTMKGGR